MSSRLSRRQFCGGLGALPWIFSGLPGGSQGASGVHFPVAEFDRARIERLANAALAQRPLTVVQVAAPGGAGRSVFYSEREQGAAADGAAVSPAAPPAFLGHVDQLVAMNAALAALVACWRLTGKREYFEGAAQQASSWFLDSPTRMEPTLAFTGMVSGEQDDRNSGLSGAVALADSARALAFLCASPLMPPSQSAGLRDWFIRLLAWLVESKKGTIARDAKSLESICWAMLAAEFSRFVRDDTQYRACAHLFRESLLRQMTFDGNFPQALRTANPYATSMFTLECLGAACESLSTPFDSLWNAALPDGRGMRSAVAWASPYLRARSKWPYLADREHFKEQPVRENALLFAARAYDEPDYADLWKLLPPDAPSAALARLHPIAQPSLWATRPPA